MSSTGEIRPVSESELRDWGAKLRDPALPLVVRARAMWGLRHARENLATQLLADYVTEVIPSRDVSGSANALLQHEAAYCLGQRGDPSAVAPLELALREPGHYPIVRHEAGEALAALCGTPGVDIDYVKSLLEEYVKSDVVAVAETCEVGLSRIEWLRRKDKLPANPAAVRAEVQYPNTIDPSPAFHSKGDADFSQPSIAELSSILANANLPLPQRYQALFSLRNASIENADDDLIEALKRALVAPGSDLLRHEVAFILGQLSITKTGDALLCSLLDPTEAPMVRHEAAMALGDVVGEAELSDTQREFAASAREALQRMCNDPEPVVRDSCALALDMADYVSSNNQFQYAEVPK